MLLPERNFSTFITKINPKQIESPRRRSAIINHELKPFFILNNLLVTHKCTLFKRIIIIHEYLMWAVGLHICMQNNL